MNDRSLTITTAAASDPAYSNQNFVNNNDSIISGETTVKNWRRKFNVRRSGGTSADAIDDTVVGTFRRTSGDNIASSTVYPIQNQVPVLLENNQLIATVSNPTITTTQTMTDRPTSSSVTRSTGRSNRNSPFCPCFSPTDSDLDDDTPIPLAIVNVETAGNNRVNRVGIDQRTASPCRQIMHMAREIRSRLVVAAETTPTNQINVGPSTVRRLASNMLIDQPYPVHTTVEYTHYLVPDMLQVTHAPYYWGVMDRYEAERLLEGKPEGTFLLRDSAQNEYLFSVSFRRYQRTLHARIEEMNHRFSFDSYDPAVFSAATVTELIDNYKDPSRCLFFEPQLTHALHRTFVFPLQHLCRSVIASRLEYNDLAKLNIPRKLNEYLREYHYKQAVRVTSYEPCSTVGTT